MGPYSDWQKVHRHPDEVEAERRRRGMMRNVFCLPEKQKTLLVWKNVNVKIPLLKRNPTMQPISGKQDNDICDFK